MGTIILGKPQQLFLHLVYRGRQENTDQTDDRYGLGKGRFELSASLCGNGRGTRKSVGAWICSNH